MCKVPVKLRELVKQRLAAAAEEIFELLERTITEYEEEARARLYGPGGLLCAGATEKGPAPPHIKIEREEEGFTPTQLCMSEDTAPPLGQSFYDDDDYNDEDQQSLPETTILQTYSEQDLPQILPATEEPTEEPGPCFENPDFSVNLLDSSHGLCVCPVCDRTFITQEELDQHMLIHMCPMSEQELLSLTNTVQVKHTKPFSCSVCGTGFSQKKSLRRHMLKHESALYKEAFSCLFCGRGFDTKGELKRHTFLHTHQQTESSVQSKRRGYACKDCGKVFFQQTRLNKHILMHGKNREEQTTASEDLETEVRDPESGKEESDAEEEPRPYECCYCSQTFCDENSLISHIETHDSNKTLFSCSVCGLRFYTERLLARHKSTHPELRTPKPQTDRRCSHCGKVYNCKGSLEKHMEKHKFERLLRQRKN